MTVRKNHQFFNIISIFILGALLLSACGGFVIQGQSEEDGSGITITGDTRVFPDESGDSGSPILGENATQILLILIGFGVFILLLLLVIGRSTGHTHS